MLHGGFALGGAGLLQPRRYRVRSEWSVSNDGSLLLHNSFLPSFTHVFFITIIESVSLSNGSSLTDPRLVYNPLYCADSSPQAVTRSNGSSPTDEEYVSPVKAPLEGHQLRWF